MVIPRLSVAIGLAGALAASQMPEFAQQYRQRLGGAVDELKRQITEFESNARAQGLSREQAIDKLQRQPDPLEQRMGRDESYRIARLERLEDQLVAFAQAGQFARIVVLARDFDPAVAEGALSNFEPALPTNAEGIVSAVVGFFLGLGIVRVLALPFRRRRRPSLAAEIAAEAEARGNRARSIALRERMNRFTLPRG